MRYIMVGLLLAGVGCQRDASSEQSMRNLKARAQEMGEAHLRHDYERIADLTYTPLIDQIGGRERFIAAFRAALEPLVRAGFRLESVRMLDPSAPVKSGSEWYAIVMYTAEFSSPLDGRATATGCYIAISRNHGKSWRFVDGNALAADPNLRRKVLPNFPAGLIMPQPQPPVFGQN